MAKSSWLTKAKRLLGKNAIYLDGDGQFALITPCGETALTLWSTQAEAENAMQHLSVCGSKCRGRSHYYIHNLGEST
jgi:hypothetical protein